MCSDDFCFTVVECDQTPTPTAPSPNSGSITKTDTDIESIFVYPNPAEDVVNINASIEGNYKVELFNMSGKLIYTQNMTFKSHQTREIPINHLPSGVYVLKCFGEHITSAERLIIK